MPDPKPLPLPVGFTPAVDAVLANCVTWDQKCKQYVQQLTQIDAQIKQLTLGIEECTLLRDTWAAKLAAIGASLYEQKDDRGNTVRFIWIVKA